MSLIDWMIATYGLDAVQNWTDDGNCTVADSDVLDDA